MATDIEALMLRIEASSSKLERDMKKVNMTFDRHARALERQAKDTGDKVGGSLGERIGYSVGRGLGVAGAAIDAAASKMKMLIAAGVAVGGLGVARTELKRLADVADDSQKIGITAELLQSLQYSATMAGGSAEEMTRALIYFNKEVGESGDKSSKLAALFRENGVSMRDAEGRLLPYADLLEKFSRLVADAANDQDAAAIAAIGFGKAGSGMVPILRDMAGGLSDVSKKAAEAGVVVTNDLVQLAGEFDDAWQSAIMAVKAGIASLLLSAAKVPALNPLKSKWSEAASSPSGDPAKVIGDVGGLSDDEIRQRIRAADALAAQLERGTPTPIAGYDRVRDGFKATKVPTSADSGGNTLDEFDKEIRKTRENTDALYAEAAAVGLDAEMKDRMKTEQELVTAARRAGKDLTPAVVAGIEKEAAAHAAAAAALDKAKESHKAMIDLQRFAGEGLAGFFSDIVSGGKNAQDALMNLTKKLADAALQAALLGSGPLASLFGTKVAGDGVGGLIGMLFGGFKFADGGIMTSAGSVPLRRYAGGGVASSPQLAMFGEGSRPEAYVPLPDGRSIPVSLSLPSPKTMGRGGVTSVSIGDTVINAPGADAASISALRSELAARDRALPAKIVEVIRDAKSRSVRGI